MPPLWCDVNLTPIALDNPEWSAGNGKPRFIRQQPCYEYLRSAGASRMFMVYDGTLNRAAWWSRPDGSFRPADQLVGEDTNQSNPPTETAVKVCARLAAAGNAYVRDADPFTPVIFDLEGPSWSRSLDDPARIDAQYALIAQAIAWAKSIDGRLRVGAYSWPFHEPGMTEQAFRRSFRGGRLFRDVADFCAPSFYTIPSVQTDAQWFDAAAEWTDTLDRFYGHLPRVAVIHPCYQVYWMEKYPHLAPLNDQPVPLELWQRQLRFLIERKYELFLWTGGTLPSEGVKRLIDAAVQLATT